MPRRTSEYCNSKKRHHPRSESGNAQRRFGGQQQLRRNVATSILRLCIASYLCSILQTINGPLQRQITISDSSTCIRARSSLQSIIALLDVVLLIAAVPSSIRQARSDGFTLLPSRVSNRPQELVRRLTKDATISFCKGYLLARAGAFRI